MRRGPERRRLPVVAVTVPSEFISVPVIAARRRRVDAGLGNERFPGDRRGRGGRARTARRQCKAHRTRWPGHLHLTPPVPSRRYPDAVRPARLTSPRRQQALIPVSHPPTEDNGDALAERIDVLLYQLVEIRAVAHTECSPSQESLFLTRGGRWDSCLLSSQAWPVRATSRPSSPSLSSA